MKTEQLPHLRRLQLHFFLITPDKRLTARLINPRATSQRRQELLRREGTLFRGEAILSVVEAVSELREFLKVV